MTARQPVAIEAASDARPAHADDGERVAERARPVPAPEHPRARLAARLAYVAVVLVATLTNLRAESSLYLAGWRLYRALHPTFHAIDVVDGLRNLVLFAGLGAVWVVTARTLRVWPAVWRATAVGVVLSVVVEGAQLFSSTRFASVLDVLTNGVGAFVGASALAVVTRLTAAARSRGSIVPPPALLLAVPYLLAALLEAFSPAGRPDDVPGAYGGPSARFAAALSYSMAHLAAGIPLSNVLLVAPAGLLATVLFTELGAPTRCAAWLAAVSGAVMFGGAELARGAAGGDMRPIAVAVHALALCSGAAAGWLLLAQVDVGGVARRRADGRIERVVLAMYVAVLLCWSLRPFALNATLGEITSAVGPNQLVPLATLASSFSLYSVADVGIGFLLYVPVGAWLSARPVASRGVLASLLPGIYLAVVTEVLQLLVRGRTFDVTDILVQAAGVCVGWIVLRRGERLHAAIARAEAARRQERSTTPQLTHGT